jgi:putative endonuclease
MTYFIYILYSKLHDRFYIGQSSNLQYRLFQHNSGKVRSTKVFRPWVIGYTEEFASRIDSVKRETYLKSPPGWNDLQEIKQKIKKTLSDQNSTR